MLVYLMQHGSCLSKEIHPEQPLSPVGRGQVERSARAARLLGLWFEVIVCSDKLRAVQTAETVAQALGYNPKYLGQSESLRPLSEPENSLDFLRRFEKEASLLVVGHLPNLNLLASHLLTPYPEPLTLGIENAGLACIETAHLAARNGSLLWLLKAQHLQLMAGA